ncbi:MAG: prepilin-type N-terminal cleavage/methylation domain-containing protein [Elusimicrobiaceae bacterium]|nr:prepilin-type N-terminal cleavage/methylation domain-containing protein [Elusimicrobiaceae bacterium]
MKKAFTLTELLMVVLVLGVLAAVATPKMKQVLETRKTTEAENMLSAVRMEQEKRCSLGKVYHTDPAKVSVLASASNSKNYSYSLSGTGAVAKSANYSIEMVSYKDGLLCCRGEGCSGLNKDYPSCDTLYASLPVDECAPEKQEVTEPEPEPEPEPDPNCENTPQPETTTVDCENGYGSTTTTYSCKNGEWVPETTGVCCSGVPPAKTSSCGSGYCGSQTRTVSCDNTTGEWSISDWSTSGCEVLPDSTERVCNICGTQTVTYSCRSTYLSLKSSGLTASQSATATWTPLSRILPDTTLVKPTYSLTFNGELVSLTEFISYSNIVSSVGDCSVSSPTECPGYSTRECDPGESQKSGSVCKTCTSAGTWQTVACTTGGGGGGGGGGCMGLDAATDGGCTYVLNTISIRGAGHWECPDETLGSGISSAQYMRSAMAGC